MTRRFLRVFERDGGICQLCGEPVDSTKAVPDPLAGNLDHIVPKCKGGNNSLGNLQLTHEICNQRKGNKLPAGYYTSCAGPRRKKKQRAIVCSAVTMPPSLSARSIR